MSSVLTATDRSHPTRTRKEGSNRFPTKTQRYRAPSVAKPMASPRPGRRPSLVPTVSVGKAPRPAPGQDTELAALQAGQARPKHPNTPDAGAKIHAAISGAKSIDDTQDGPQGAPHILL